MFVSTLKIINFELKGSRNFKKNQKLFLFVYYNFFFEDLKLLHLNFLFLEKIDF